MRACAVGWNGPQVRSGRSIPVNALASRIPFGWSVAKPSGGSERHKTLPPGQFHSPIARSTAGRGNTGTGTLGVQLLSFLDKGYDPASGALLALLRGREDGLDVKTMLGGRTLAGAPDFIDDGVP